VDHLSFFPVEDKTRTYKKKSINVLDSSVSQTHRKSSQRQKIEDNNDDGNEESYYRNNHLDR